MKRKGMGEGKWRIEGKGSTHTPTPLARKELKNGCAPISSSNGDLSKYFSEWIEPWLQCADPDGACRAWISTVESLEDKEGAFASRDRYLASEQVQRGVWMEPKNFLFQQKTSNWKGKWPAPTVAAHKLTPSEEAIEYAKKRRAAK